MSLRLLATFLLLATSACSIKRVATNKLGNALASGDTAYERDEDPELVAAAMPFGLKLYESLLAESPKHTGLLLAAASGFTEYAYAFVDCPGSEAKEAPWSAPTPCATGRANSTCAPTVTACAGWSRAIPVSAPSSTTMPSRRSSGSARRTCRCSIGRRLRWGWRSPFPRPAPR